MKLKAGQILWLKLPFGETDDLSRVYHPYLILDINQYGVGVVESGQMDSENDRPWELLRGDGYYDKRMKFGSDSFRDMYFTKSD